jgi:hypothetical protein
MSPTGAGSCNIESAKNVMRGLTTSPPPAPIVQTVVPCRAHTIPFSPDPACCVTLPVLQGIADAESRFDDVGVFRAPGVGWLFGLAESWREAGD